MSVVTRLDETSRFLAALDREEAKFTFQTFDDNAERKDKRLARVRHGKFNEHRQELEELNVKGAGIFVTVNKTDGKGRKTANILQVRALFVDLDGAPLEPVMRSTPTPHIVIESSPGRWHAYWRIADVKNEQFRDLQRALAARFNGDQAVNDLPRVMRVAGFVHRKGAPFVTRIESIRDSDPYTAKDFPDFANIDGNCNDHLGGAPDPNASNPRGETERGTQWKKLNNEALRHLAAWVPALFPGARFAPETGSYRVSSAILGRDLTEDLSITPNGIKDFGVHDIGDPREGKRTAIDLTMQYGNKNLAEASDWLRGRLRKPGAPPSAVALLWHGDAQTKTKWLVRNRLPETGAGLIVGQWGMYKTFVALDLAAHVMLGWDWTGEPVYRQAGTLYFAPEGAGSIAMRLAALVEYNIKPKTANQDDLFAETAKVDPERLPFAWASSVPTLLGVGNDDPMPTLLATAELAQSRFVEKWNLPLGLIVVDTMATATGWSDENNNAEASRAMAVLRRLSEETGAVVVGVDHLGKNVEVGSRGASAKEANADFVLVLLGNKGIAGGATNTRLALRKMREGPAGIAIPFASKVVDMGKDDKGFPITSVVIDWNETHAAPPPKRKATANQVLDDVLALAIAEHGKLMKLAGGQEVRAVKHSSVLAAFKDVYKSEKSLNDQAKRQAFRMALQRAEGQIKSQLIDGVAYLWHADDGTL